MAALNRPEKSSVRVPSQTHRGFFNRKELAWVLLPVRVYLGYQWLTAGWLKITSAGWMSTGSSLHTFWQRAVNAPVGGTAGVVHYGWYHAFLRYALMHNWSPWFAKLVALGETTVGIMLILGAFTGLVATTAAILNFNYMLAGSASANPVLFTLAISLMLTWRVAGRAGLDSLLLPAAEGAWHRFAVQARSFRFREQGAVSPAPGRRRLRREGF